MFEKIVLPNGVRIVKEQIDGIHTATMGIYVGSGSRYESKKDNGASHFIEHMTFKGTKDRSSVQIAEEMDAMGGGINAYTSRETTCFYGRVMDKRLGKAADLFSDIFFNSVFSEADIETERGVILEEMNMYKDAPDDMCSENLNTVIYKGSSLSRPVLGTPSSIAGVTGSSLLEYKWNHYKPENIVISLAGNLDPAVVEAVIARFGAMEKGKQKSYKKAVYTPGIICKKKKTEQNHIILAFPAIPAGDPRHYTENILSSILGGGTSSRLFQKVREEKGLCYTVYAYSSNYEDVGSFGIYTALAKEQEKMALETICDEVRRIAEEGVTEEELTRAIEQAESAVMMGLESAQSRMAHMGRSELLLGEIPTAEEIAARYESITREDVRTLAQEYFQFQNASLSCVGKPLGIEEYEKMIH